MSELLPAELPHDQRKPRYGEGKRGHMWNWVGRDNPAKFAVYVAVTLYTRKFEGQETRWSKSKNSWVSNSAGDRRLAALATIDLMPSLIPFLREEFSWPDVLLSNRGGRVVTEREFVAYKLQQRVYIKTQRDRKGKPTEQATSEDIRANDPRLVDQVTRLVIRGGTILEEDIAAAFAETGKTFVDYVYVFPCTHYETKTRICKPGRSDKETQRIKDVKKSLEAYSPELPYLWCCLGGEGKPLEKAVLDHFGRSRVSNSLTEIVPFPAEEVVEYLERKAKDMGIKLQRQQ